jgi:protein-S-isoprenylcysteine O-methyltransferase Ste14
MRALKQDPAPKLVVAMDRFKRYLSEDFLGGPRLLKMSTVINFQKGLTGVFVLGLMFYFENFTTPAWVYLALHGSYGLIWLAKHAAFPDRNWERRITIGGASMMFLLVLGPYWIAPFLLISDWLGPSRALPGPSVLGAAIALHTLGVAMMSAADAQKYFTLKYRPGLIQAGMFKHIRHPNYLGEMLIYAAYALLAMHWLPWVVLAFVWSFVFSINILIKDASLSRYPEWRAYKARTGRLFPRLLTRS